MKYLFFYHLVVAIVLSTTAIAQEKSTSEQEFELEIEAEFRQFIDHSAFNGQKEFFPSLALRPSYQLDWNNSKSRINFKGFFRLDRDDARTHWDVRELYYQRAQDNWELRAGFNKVFWGVTESNHLVDIINQTDQVESFDGEQKLGQAMVQFTWSTKLGNFDFFYLPHHRRRTFAGARGRFRFPQVIEDTEIGYESKSEEWNQDFAVRWSHYFGIIDLALSYFQGNGREPLFAFDPNTSAIQAFYPLISQGGLELQITHDAFLWKLESIYRHAEAQAFFALTAGVEYTFSNIDGNGLDIGVLTEYLFDERDELALNALQNDLFFGSRIAFNDVNDTSILIGGILDLESSSRIFSLEASRRFGSSLTASLEARIFNAIDENELILSNFRRDSFIRATIVQFF